jgi:dipeptidyl aminopeptidase/acylaminoacyl peptidase
MLRTMMRRLFVLGSVLVSVFSSACAPVARSVSRLHTEGVPETPAALRERLRQYTNVRSAVFFDWDAASDGLLIGTRFAEARQVHHVAHPKATRRQLTFFPEPVSDARSDPANPGGFLFRMDQGGGERYQYFWYDLETGLHRRLTDGRSRNDALRVANKGGRYAFVSTARNGRDFDLWLLDGPRATPRMAKALEGRWSVVAWSPDDARILLVRFISVRETELHLFDVASGALTRVRPGVRAAYGAAAFGPRGDAIYVATDEQSEVRQLVRIDLGEPATKAPREKIEVLTPWLRWDVASVALSRDGAWIAYTANTGGQAALYLARAEAPERATRIKLRPGVASGLRFDPKGARLAFTFEAATAPANVYVIDVAPWARGEGVPRPIAWTESEVGGLDTRRFVSPSLIEFPTFDGRRIPAFVYRPHAAKGRAPVIINIHGGPESQAKATFSSLAQFAANELGAAMIYPNVRGSLGYGKSYVALDDGVRREDSVKDISALLDWIAQQPDLDPRKVAVIGGSYGGYMTLATMVHESARVACGVDYVGISNFVTFLRNTASYRRDVRRAEYGDERDPKIRAVLEAISPTRNASKIRKPLFVVQGANDPRVPASEAEQIVAAVRAQGHAVWYMLARDEGHGFRKKANRARFLEAIVMFFERVCFGGAASPAAK